MPRNRGRFTAIVRGSVGWSRAFLLLTNMPRTWDWYWTTKFGNIWLAVIPRFWTGHQVPCVKTLVLGSCWQTCMMHKTSTGSLSGYTFLELAVRTFTIEDWLCILDSFIHSATPWCLWWALCPFHKRPKLGIQDVIHDSFIFPNCHLNVV